MKMWWELTFYKAGEDTQLSEKYTKSDWQNYQLPKFSTKLLRVMEYSSCVNEVPRHNAPKHAMFPSHVQHSAFCDLKSLHQP
jgi:hypothetical protein